MPDAPASFDATDLMPGVAPFDDPSDHLLPGGTYLDDFVLLMKGMSTPTRFCTWGALVQVSSVLKRDAWLKWYPGNFFGNLFVILVGPPRWQGKSTVIDDYVDPILRTFHKELPAEWRGRKEVRAYHSKITPEALFDQLTHETVFEEMRNGKMVEVHIPWSNAVLLMSELGTFLGKQKYNEGLIQKLTDLYSCKAEDDDTTKGKGKRIARDTYVTLLGGTTQEAIEKTIPDAAMADGFLSRVILVKGREIVREWPRPYAVVQGGMERVTKRLAWIAANKNGEYTFTKEADAAHDRTNAELARWTKTHPDPRLAAVCSRKDLHILKVAMLIRAARYDLSRVVTLDDYEAAQRIVDDAYVDVFEVVSEVGASPEVKAEGLVRRYLESRGEVTRKDLISRFSSKHGKAGIPARVLTTYLRDLAEEGLVEVWYEGESQGSRVLEKAKESYRVAVVKSG